MSGYYLVLSSLLVVRVVSCLVSTETDGDGRDATYSTYLRHVRGGIIEVIQSAILLSQLLILGLFATVDILFLVRISWSEHVRMLRDVRNIRDRVEVPLLSLLFGIRSLIYI